MNRRQLSLALLLGLGLGVISLLAPFVAPYPADRQFRDLPYQPPASVSLVKWDDGLEMGPWVKAVSDGKRTTVPSESRRVRLLSSGAPYRLLGWVSTTHLFGTDDPERPVFLLGSDSLGRDVFSRIVLGSQFSVATGLVGVLGTLLVGTLFGVLSGYGPDWVDSLLMRVCDLFIALPGLFLILGLRAVFPLEQSAFATFWMMVLIFVLVGWASVSRVIRGQIKSTKESPHVLAAISYGAGHWRIISRHILPFTGGYLMVQATFLFPLLILGEITLSFLGVGIQEPDVSLGSLLSAAGSLVVVHSYPWMLSPVPVILGLGLLFSILGESLRGTRQAGPRMW